MIAEVGSFIEISRRGEDADFMWSLAGMEEPVWNIKENYCLLTSVFIFGGSRWQLSLERLDQKGKASRPLQFKLRQWTGYGTVPVRYWLGIRRVNWYEEVKEDMIGRGKNEDTVRSLSINHSWLSHVELSRSYPSLLFPRAGGPRDLAFIIRFRTGLETDSEMRSLEGREEIFTQTDLDDNRALIEHYKKYLHHADDHNVLLKVKGKEFKAHKSILQARSPVFKEMIKCKMVENGEDIITIEDVDPDCFDVFLMYIYTGETENVSAANAIGLYIAGDKYNFPSLKRRCLNILKASLSTSLVCDVITLAVTYKEEELLESAMAFVTFHLEEVMESEKWQQFLLSNPMQAHEISLKALKKRQTSETKK